MACDCNKQKTRTIVQAAGTPQQRIVQITFITVCNMQNIELPEPPGEGEHMVARAAKAAKRKAKKREVKPVNFGKRIPAAIPAPAPVPTCMNSIAVALNAATTAGLKISEVTFGADTFATNIAVGAQVQWDEVCDPQDCEEKIGSARVVDAQGNFVATVGGFKVCRCRI